MSKYTFVDRGNAFISFERVLSSEKKKEHIEKCSVSNLQALVKMQEGRKS